MFYDPGQNRFYHTPAFGNSKFFLEIERNKEIERQRRGKRKRKRDRKTKRDKKEKRNTNKREKQIKKTGLFKSLCPLLDLKNHESIQNIYMTI